MIKLGTAVNIITAVMFTLFTAYQIFLLIHIDAQRNGRLTGIILYLFLTAASFFALVHKPGIKFARSVLLIAGLLLLFGIRLINVPVIFGFCKYAFRFAVRGVCFFAARYNRFGYLLPVITT